MASDKAPFSGLSPDRVIDAVEAVVGKRMSGLASPLPSYINRVYELQAMSGERLIGKFYRPGRWTRAALEDEHRFTLDCAAEEIPVIPPMTLADGGTLGESDGVFFAVFPKRYGRQLEINGEEDWRRIGAVIGRTHLAGSRAEAPNRVVARPEISTASDIRYLLEGDFVGPIHRTRFADMCRRVLDALIGLFDDAEYIRIHGDCHRGNLLDRPDEGLMVIDFDDMLMGPPVQDLWLLLPDRPDRCGQEIQWFMDGYEMFREFDWFTSRLIEPLRAMRVIYFLAWQARQSGDAGFHRHFPDWGSDAFWFKETEELGHQLEEIRRSQG